MPFRTDTVTEPVTFNVEVAVCNGCRAEERASDRDGVRRLPGWLRARHLDGADQEVLLCPKCAEKVLPPKHIQIVTNPPDRR